MGFLTKRDKRGERVRSVSSHLQGSTSRPTKTIFLFMKIQNYQETHHKKGLFKILVLVGDGGINQEDFDTEGMDIPSETTCISGTPVIVIIFDFTK